MSFCVKWEFCYHTSVTDLVCHLHRPGIASRVSTLAHTVQGTLGVAGNQLSEGESTPICLPIFVALDILGVSFLVAATESLTNAA